MTIKKYTSFNAGINTTLLEADGFYGDVSVDMTQRTGRFGKGYAWGINDSLFNRTRYWALDEYVGSTVFFTAGVLVPPGSNGGTLISLWNSAAGAPAASFKFGTLGEIYVYNSVGTLVGQTPIGVWALDRWFQFEIKVYIHGTAGTIEVRYNTKQVLNIINVNTRPSSSSSFSVDAMKFYTPGSVEAGIDQVVFNELIISDDQGSVNNSFLGTVNVNSQVAIANGYVNNWSIGGSSPASTNWQSVLNASLNDTKYVYDGTAGDLDFYDLDPNLNTPVVYAVQVKAAMRQDDATQRIGRVGLRLSGTTYIGSKDFYLDQTYRFYSDMWELNPNTGVAWTGTEVNGLEAGVKVQS